MPGTDDPPPRCPAEPDPAECCGEGCANCVFDLYEAAFGRYEVELAEWQARQGAGDAGDQDSRTGGAGWASS